MKKETYYQRNRERLLEKQKEYARKRREAQTEKEAEIERAYQKKYRGLQREQSLGDVNWKEEFIELKDSFKNLRLEDLDPTVNLLIKPNTTLKDT